MEIRDRVNTIEQLFYFSFVTPSGITTIPGVETPGSTIELRKKRVVDDRLIKIFKLNDMENHELKKNELLI